MTRVALRFGRKEHLIGVIHEAENNPRPLGILLWNTGISHRIGPFRIHVDLAERLAQLGFTVLRFDLSRLGDSGTADQDFAIQDIFTRDINDAAQVLEDRYQIKDLISVGICSGAVDAWYHARQDTRIRGLVMVDSFVYETLRHDVQFFCKRLFSPKRWKRLIGRLLFPWIARKTLNPVNDFLDPNYPALTEASDDTQKLVDRGTEMLVLYTGGFHPWYSYRRQFSSMLDVRFDSRLQLEYWPDVDHLFTLLEDRKRFIRLVQIWVQEKFLKPMMDADITARQAALPAPALEPEPKPEPLPEPATIAEPILVQEVLRPEPVAAPEPVAPLEPQAAAEDSALLELVLNTMNNVLRPARLEADDSFFDYGGNSVLAIKTCQMLAQELGYHVPITLIYAHMKPRELAKALQKDKPSLATAPIETPPSAPTPTETRPTPPAAASGAVAIIGMACKVPGAKNLQEFWSMIREGREGITHFKREELDSSLPETMIKHSNYVAARGIIEGDRFDHEFFQMNRREAVFLDPQQRVLMETCWQALEDAGWAHRREQARIGVYVGVGTNTYQSRNLMVGNAAPHSEEEYFAQMGNDKDYVATHIAYYLDLKGPAVSVHTACSTSLVAVAEGIKTLLTDEADIVVAGAAAVNAPMASGHLYQEGSIFSRDGHCRPFAADASGTLFSDGSAVVVLKRLEQALADGDPIHAVIQGWALNNDGRSKSSFAAPSVDGQAQVIRKAYQRAGWSPRSVAYMECHGTATPIGDPIEIEGLRRAFQSHTSDQHFCALGSVKANIGHLTAAAGTIGLIKAALVLEKGEIPPALHAWPLNPELRLTSSPFHVPKVRQPWPQNTLRRAAVSSFGVGGTNAHVLLEGAPVGRPAAVINGLDPWLTLSWSAKDPHACLRYQEALAALWQDPTIPAADLSYTLANSRSRFPHRQSLTGRQPQEWQQAALRLKKNPAYYPEKKLPVCLMFPGQGSQYTDMGRELARAWPRFAQHYERALSAFTQRFDLDLATALDGVESEQGPLLNSTIYTQPALFCVEWALAQSLIECGLPTAAVMGHSIGELAAAAIAGVFSFDDAIRIVYHRARTMQAAKPGMMLAVRASREKVQSLLTPDVSICVINSSEACVIGGERAAVEPLLTVMKSKGIAFKPLETSHAFHSAMMDAVLDDFRQSLQGITFNAPQRPLYSTVTGQRLSAAEAQSIDYWVQQIRQPVNFLAAVQTIAAQEDILFLEIGPRDALSRFVQQILRDEGRWPSQALLPKSAANGEDVAFTEGISELANYGTALFVPKTGRVISAPVYPFQGEKLWLEPKTIEVPASTRSARSATASAAAPAARPAHAWLKKLAASLAGISGLEAHEISTDASWVSLGLDSLILMQWSLKMQKEWGINMNLNMLQNELQNLQELAMHLQGLLPQDAPLIAQSLPTAASGTGAAAPAISQEPVSLGAVLQQQIALMTRQLELLSGLYGRPKENPTEMAQFPTNAASGQSRHTTGQTKAPIVATPPAPAPTPAPAAVASAPVAPAVPIKSAAEPLPTFLNRLVHEGEIEFATDRGILRMPRYRGAFLALDEDGQPALFIENPEQTGEYWQVVGE